MLRRRRTVFVGLLSNKKNTRVQDTTPLLASLPGAQQAGSQESEATLTGKQEGVIPGWDKIKHRRRTGLVDLPTAEQVDTIRNNVLSAEIQRSYPIEVTH